jgi:hypothetical protein
MSILLSLYYNNDADHLGGCGYVEQEGLPIRDGNFTRGFGYPRISDPSVSGSGTKFNPRVLSIPDP